MHEAAPNSVVIAIMGATGTGKSTFTKHVTGDEGIIIGHSTDSQTFDVQKFNFTDPNSGAPGVLVDTPGFDDSREGVTDTDILEKIAAFLRHDGGQRLNGLIYMHRITDNRVSGVSRKNLKMFGQLCGDKNIGNVRIVTTHWDQINVQEGASREAELAGGAFKTLVAAGAKMTRQDQGKASALRIVSELSCKAPVEVQLLTEIKQGKALKDTSVGNVINEEVLRLQKQQEEEKERLRREMEAAAAERARQLRAQEEAERRALAELQARIENERIRLQQEHERMLNQAREQERRRQEELERQLREAQAAMERARHHHDGGGCQIQ